MLLRNKFVRLLEALVCLLHGIIVKIGGCVCDDSVSVVD